MNSAKPGYRDQSTKRTVARVLGILSMAVAIVLVVIAIQDLVATGDSFAGPTKFWLFFLAMPFFLVGGIGLQLGFGGAYARYAAGELAPTARDTVGYLGLGGREGAVCARCGARNDPSAKFCDDCGAAQAKACPACGAGNAADARFCAECGDALGQRGVVSVPDSAKPRAPGRRRGLRRRRLRSAGDLAGL